MPTDRKDSPELSHRAPEAPSQGEKQAPTKEAEKEESAL